MLRIPLVHLCLEFLKNCCGPKQFFKRVFIKSNALLYAGLRSVWFMISLHREL